MESTERVYMLKNIDEMKEELITIALEYGLTNPKTVKFSQKLDKLLNQYNQELRKK